MENNLFYIKEAYEYFKNKNFLYALFMFEKASKIIGRTNIKANIDICKKKLGINNGYIINKKLPATLHFEEANPEMDINNSHFTILKKTKDWECNDLRRAGVSSFGVGGTNVHVILEEYKDNNLPVQNTSHEIVFMLSAKSEASLKNQIQKWIEF